VHRDLKPENIVYDTREKSATIKIIDFGTSRKLVGDEKLTKRLGTVTKKLIKYFIAILYCSRGT
jgi:serine/threonine protein kinase